MNGLSLQLTVVSIQYSVLGIPRVAFPIHYPQSALIQHSSFRIKPYTFILHPSSFRLPLAPSPLYHSLHCSQADRLAAGEWFAVFGPDRPTPGGRLIAQSVYKGGRFF